MRDVERQVDKKPGVFRIAVFGDSMTEGVQVDLEQTYTQQLEKLLLARGLSVEVLNFGMNGYSPLSGFLLYDTYGKTFHPDLVIHAVFTDNDIADGDSALAAGQVGAPFVVPGTGPHLQSTTRERGFIPGLPQGTDLHDSTVVGHVSSTECHQERMGGQQASGCVASAVCRSSQAFPAVCRSAARAI
jgi:hypothetical protein